MRHVLLYAFFAPIPAPAHFDTLPLGAELTHEAGLTHRLVASLSYWRKAGYPS